jgi:hypothetical protein
VFGIPEIARNIVEQLLVRFSARKLEQFGRVGQRLVEATDRVDNVTQRGTFAPEVLRTLGLRPDGRVLEFALDFLEPLVLDVVVKDTP